MPSANLKNPWADRYAAMLYIIRFSNFWSFFCSAKISLRSTNNLVERSIFYIERIVIVWNFVKLFPDHCHNFRSGTGYRAVYKAKGEFTLLDFLSG